MTNMEPYEKEEIFAREVESLITRFCSEYNMTYAQIIGVLDIAKFNLTREGFEDSEDEMDE